MAFNKNTWTKEYPVTNAGLRALARADGMRKYKGAYKAPRKVKKES